MSEDEGVGTDPRETPKGQTPGEPERQAEDRTYEVPIPSPRAATLLMHAALQEKVHELALQSARLSDSEKLMRFRQHLAGLQWKRFYCHESPAQRRERIERLRQELVDRAQRPPKPIGRITADGSITPTDDLPRKPLTHEEEPAVDPRTEAVLACEREASRQWREAHAAMWIDFTLPLAQSARDVAEIAQREKRHTNEVREADELAHALWKHCMSAPSEETMALARSVSLLVDQLARQAPESVDPQPSSPNRRRRPRADGQRRPKPEVIDATAKKCLRDALRAAKDAGEAYVPRRADIAKAVSKALNYRIAVETLFGTRRPGCDQKHRYPDFMELWQETQRLSRASRPGKRSGWHE